MTLNDDTLIATQLLLINTLAGVCPCRRPHCRLWQSQRPTRSRACRNAGRLTDGEHAQRDLAQLAANDANAAFDRVQAEATEYFNRLEQGLT